MVNISAAMARPLSDAITDMVETVRKLGPSPVTHNGHKGSVSLPSHESRMEIAP
jgi:hypothetical protein